MRAFSYVGNTWLLAQFIHPFVFYCFYAFVLNDPLDAGAVASLFAASLVLSLPALAASAFFIHVVPVIRIPVTVNLFIWLMLASTAILINVALFALLLGDESLFVKGWDLYVPALLAAAASILLRYKQFKNFIDYENNLHKD